MSAPAPPAYTMGRSIEFVPAFQAWMERAERPGVVPPDTPFHLPQYQPAWFALAFMLRLPFELGS